MIKERLNKLRKLMEERSIDAYLIPTSDFHETEYVGEHFKARHFMSNFSGSQGTLLVMKDAAYLWVDGRYFIQAAQQLKDTSITQMNIGEEGVLTIEQLLQEQLKENDTLGFDGRVLNSQFVKNLLNQIGKNISLYTHEDLVDLIWENRPALPQEQGFFYAQAYSGKATREKLVDIREEMKQKGANTHLITSLDDIAWILNIRGKDIAHFPVVLSYLILFEESGILFVDKKKLTPAMEMNLAVNRIRVKNYDEVYEEVKTFTSENVVLLNEKVVNYQLVQNINKDVKVINDVNPSQLMKAIKNEVELENTRLAHIKDGAAVTKFMYWLKNNVGKIEIDEVSAADYLAKCRYDLGAIDLSFDTIAAYKANAAMMHYSASEDSKATLSANSMLLVDSGGHYLEGTTDITRTFVLGEITQEERLYFTTALKSNIDLSMAHFLYGCRGMNLDILARGPLWKLQMDYKCGTGHGIGHLLNVHEGPNGFRWKIVAERNDSCVLEAGMICTNEPGVYVEGQFGIRHENEMIVKNGIKNEYGQFMHFETITFAPFDLDGIDVSLLTSEEKNWLNNYHQEVYNKLESYMNDEEKAWLKHVTRAL